RVYTDYDGSLGAVYAAKKHKGYLYLGTNQGLFYKKDAAASEEYQLILDTKGQVWSLNVLGDALICGHHEGTFRVEENRVIPIANIAGTWDVHQMNDTLAIQGNYSGLYILERKETGWQLRNKLEGFDISSRYFAFSGPLELYVSHEYKGVFKLHIDENFRKITESSLLQQLPKGAKSSIFKYNNEVLYAYEEGIFRLNKSAQVFEKDSLLSHTFLESGGYSSGKLTYDHGNNRLWAFNEQEVLYFEPGILADQLKVRRIALPAKTRKDIPGFENITYLDANTYLLGNATGYIVLDTEKLSDEKYSIKLRTIKNGSREGELVTLDQTTAEAFHYKQNTFAFDFSVAEYEKFRAVVYQYRLKGLYEEWTNWSTSATASFENLPPGTYTFEARARIGDQLSENTLHYSFTIARPWYLSVVAIIIYGVLLVL
ncbi:MAG: triple tyrosine motif-containing protein, partial [Bacteroidota bacterium]|nr:triple tyrosine motif-containing protein [Bacteroidota bacterium]